MNINTQLLNCILQQITLKHLTEKDCLKACDINTSFFSDWKSGKTKSPSFDKIYRILKYLDISLDNLNTYLNNELNDDIYQQELIKQSEFSKDSFINMNSFGNFGERLKQAIEISNLSQKELAEKIGVSKTSINNYAQGIIPEFIILYKISRECNVTIDWLLTGEINFNKNLQTNKQEDSFTINKETPEKTPEKTMLLKIYNWLDEKKQYILLQRALELLNEENSTPKSSNFTYPLQTEIKAVGRDGKTQTIKFSEDEAIKHQKFLEENNPELAIPRKPKKF